ncbi:hypothetical protein GCM10010512_23680 [Streptomyces thermoviolaceus subsp. thermoviolaceus]|nr:hypothetical protein GCM10010499_49350 [Streptomyces thermoviolaceus subsp. apingens]GHA91426.1 hypothetical protein GCM10010512_23680 [Streptomyces thermoviolaceus subsp. thermoviolaceus]
MPAITAVATPPTISARRDGPRRAPARLPSARVSSRLSPVRVPLWFSPMRWETDIRRPLFPRTRTLKGL